MDGLSPHLEYRIGRLSQEADARRLAETASVAANRPEPPRRRGRAVAIATALVAMSITIGSFGAMFVLASDSGVPASDGTVAPSAPTTRAALGDSHEPFVPDPAFGRGRVSHR